MSLGELSAATRVAAKFGLVSTDALVLQRTNNVVVWLRPHEVIAKVSKSPDRDAGLILEHDVATVVAAQGGPVGQPVSGIDPTEDEENRPPRHALGAVST